MSAPAAPALDPAVVRAAARWLVRLHSGNAVAADFAACERWRAAHPAHEAAWQKAERLARQFGAVPPALGVPVLTRPATHASRRAVLRTLAVLGVAAPAAWLGWRHAPWQGWTADYATATGKRREAVLADGSRLTLNTATALDVAWSDAQRLVRLHRGEVYVRTAPDTPGAHRPFIVETPQGRLRALGTRFVVRIEDGGGAPRTRLTVLEHRVEATPRGGGAPLVVDAGQHTVLGAAGAAPPARLAARRAVCRRHAPRRLPGRAGALPPRRGALRARGGGFAHLGRVPARGYRLCARPAARNPARAGAAAHALVGDRGAARRGLTFFRARLAL
jgi:transmembrane sensor